MQLWLTEVISFELVCLQTVFMSHIFSWPIVSCSHIQTVRNQFYAALLVNNISSIHLMSTLPFVYLSISQQQKLQRWLLYLHWRTLL